MKKGRGVHERVEGGRGYRVYGMGYMGGCVRGFMREYMRGYINRHKGGTQLTQKERQPT